MVWQALVRAALDLKEGKILMKLAIPLVAGVVLVSILGYGLFGFVLTSDWLAQSAWVQALTSWVAETEQTISGIPLIGALLVWLLSAVVTVTAGVLGVLLGSYLVLLFAMVIAGLMTDALVKTVHDLHYPEVTYHGHGSMWRLLMQVAGYGLGILLLLVVTLPILFVPGLNVVWFWWLGFLFFRYSMLLDVGSVILPQERFEREKPFMNWAPTWILLVFYGLSMLPVLSLLAPMLAVIALSHYFFMRLKAEQAA